MTSINAYLTFNGNCREAMNFYRESLGGELNLQTVEDSPMAGQLPANMKKNIMHSSLAGEGFTIMGSDMCGPEGVVKGNNVSLILNCTSEEEIRNRFQVLSSGGKVKHPLEDTFWGALFGDLTDRYGIQWLLNFDKSQKA
jgi:PhnB protein